MTSVFLPHPKAYIAQVLEYEVDILNVDEPDDAEVASTEPLKQFPVPTTANKRIIIQTDLRGREIRRHKNMVTAARELGLKENKLHSAVRYGYEYSGFYWRRLYPNF